LSELTKEWLLKTIAELEEERDAVPGVVNEDAAMALAAMKLALASLEAEPVAWRYRHHNGLAPSNWRYVDIEIECNMAPNYQRQALFTAPPAAVSVPDEVISAIENLKRTLVNCNRYNYCSDAVKRLEDTCRAAMLQGADGTLTNEGTKRVGELVMWVKRLASSLRKANPDSKLQSDAMDYLSRNGLIGVEDILR
jgi:hypothetical protein